MSSHRLSLAVSLSLLAIGCASLDAGPVPDDGFGAEKDGLQLGLSITEDRQLRVTMRNTGKKDTYLNLGMTLANGRRHYPSSLGLKVVDASSKRHAFTLLLPPIGGRVDDYLVPLRANSSHTLRMKLSEFWSPDGVLANKLEPGDYVVSMTMKSDKPRNVNGDMVGVGLLNVWAGELETAAVKMKVR